MTDEIKAPQFPESVEEGTLMTWHSKEGDSVSRDDKIADIETDKIVLEVSSPGDGVLSKVLKQEGDTVKPGEVLAKLDAGSKSETSSDKEEKKTGRTEDKEKSGDKKESRKKADEDAGGDEDDDKSGDKDKASGGKSDEVMASPAARKLLEEHELAASDITGTGRGGRITREDVVNFVEESDKEEENGYTGSGEYEEDSEDAAKSDKPVESVAARGRREQRVPMTRIRARIAERLVEAQQTAAILTTFNDIDMKPVRDLRNRYRNEFEKEHNVKLGYMSFFVKASTEALKRFPVINASVDGGDIIYHGYYDIGIAVSTKRGLVVPILRDADQLTFAEIEKAILDYAERAQEGRLLIDELTGGTFSITNGGIFGSLLSTPILNPPQSAILGMHKIQERPVVVDGRIEISPMMYVALSYDHRIVDGRDAVLFLTAVKELMEDPARLLLQV